MMVNEHNDHGCRRMSVLDLAGFLARSEVNGPGIRAVIWVQGCPHRCEGCFNESFQPFSSANRVAIDELVAGILTIADIDGVTFSGGEPFAHAAPLAELGGRLRAAGLSVVTYTGYTTDQIADGKDPEWPALLAVTDLLITGPYIADLSSPDPLKGSANQEVILIGTRLAMIKDKTQTPVSGGTEFTITADGIITTTGFPVPALLDHIASHPGGA